MLIIRAKNLMIPHLNEEEDVLVPIIKKFKLADYEKLIEKLIATLPPLDLLWEVSFSILCDMPDVYALVYKLLCTRRCTCTIFAFFNLSTFASQLSILSHATLLF